MKPPPFDYVRAQSIEHALDLLAEHGDEAKVVSGGQSLIPLLNLRLARPSVLVDLGDLPMGQVERAGDRLTTGALVRHRTLCEDADVAAANPLLAAAARFIGHTAIRNRGTVGGSIAHADPAAELPLVAVTCDATVLVRSATGAREIAAQDFFAGPFMTALEPEEIVYGLRWPVLGAGDTWGFSEIAERAGDFADAAAAVVVRASGSRVAVAGVPGSPLRLPTVEAWLDAAPADADQARSVARQALQTDTATDDEHVRTLVEEMVVRAVRQAATRRSAA